MSFYDRKLPAFRIGLHDRITFRSTLPGESGKVMKVAYFSDENVVMQPADGPGFSETFSHSQLQRLNAGGKIHHELEYYLPAALRTQPLLNLGHQDGPPMNSAERARVDVRYAMTMAFLELTDKSLGKDRIKISDAEIEAGMHRIQDRASEYLAEQAPSLDLIAAQREIEDGTRKRKPQGGTASRRPDRFSPRTLRRWAKAVELGGKWALRDKCCDRGNRSAHFSPEVHELMMRVIGRDYLRRNGLKGVQTVLAVRQAFLEENVSRRAQGLSEFPIPGREAIRGVIKRLDKFSVLVARRGIQEALKKMKPVGKGLEVSRPLQRVEIDECKIDLITIMKETGLFTLFSAEELEALGFTGKKARWWVIMAIDCRTRVILSMRLTNDPKTTAAIEGLRMIMEDKGEFADKVGSLTGWYTRGKPEALVSDNGVFRSMEFTDAAAGLGINLLRTIAGSPSMRGRIERLFRTTGLSLLSRLSGYTFGSVQERGDHPSDKEACLTTEDLCHALVRWITDIYHNTPHEGLYGLTPLQKWDQDMAEGNFPLHALPTKEVMRMALGVRLNRQLSRTGITIEGVRYHSEALVHQHLSLGDHDVEVRWDHTDIGAVSVRLESGWEEVRTVHRTGPDGSPFDGLSAAEWNAVMRALRAGDPERKEFDQRVVFAAINDIKALNTRKRLESGLVNQDWSPERMKSRDEALCGFCVGEDTPRTRDTQDGIGRVIEPRAPEVRTQASPDDTPLTDTRSTVSKFSRTAKAKE